MSDNKGLLLACYELGHQPLSLAWPLAVLFDAGYPATGVDLAVERFPTEDVARASFVGIAVSMHTALRLGVQAARRVRALNSATHIFFYGLYAWLNADYLLEQEITDAVIAGEYEGPLAGLVQALERGGDPDRVSGVRTRTAPAQPHLARLNFPVPVRDLLPPLTKYARFEQNGYHHLAGYTETSRGCLHTCLHCPVVPIYNGRFFVVPVEIVMADIRQQVAAGAGHITFGDPDFLNGPGHTLNVTRSLHAEFPQVTFDFTTKVEHILEKRYLLPELRELGAAFVVSAFESLSDEVLLRLEKGHTVADMDTALEILGEVGLSIQPTWVSFTPWTTLDDYLAMLKWIRTRNLTMQVPVIQLSIRLLVPPNSALPSRPDTKTWLGPLDAANFTHQWAHPDPRMDELQQRVAIIVEQVRDADPLEAFAAVEQVAYQMAGRDMPGWTPPANVPVPSPRLTEDWFC